MDINKKIDRAEQELQNWRTPFGDKERSWEAIQAGRSSAKAGRVIPMWVKLVSAAAAAALVIGVFSNRDQEFSHTTYAAHKTVELPDGSIAQLNASSTLRYTNDWDEERVVTLDGEAFFSVKKGSKFRVETDEGSVEVLGTSFNVYSRGEDLEVICRTGKVQVTAGDDQVILTKDQETELVADDLIPAREAHTNDSWVRGEFAFDDESLTRVFDEIERQFGVTVVTNDIQEGRFTGEFSVDDLDSALKVICSSMALDYSVEGTTVRIESKS